MKPRIPQVPTFFGFEDRMLGMVLFGIFFSLGRDGKTREAC